MHGHRRVFLTGFAAASVAALATACAWDAASLIGLRIVAAVVGAATQPTSMALIFSVYAPQDRVRAMGWWAMMGAAAPAAASRLTSQVGVAFGITTLTMVYGGINTGPALANAFLVGAVLAAGAVLSSACMAPRAATDRWRLADGRGGQEA